MYVKSGRFLSPQTHIFLFFEQNDRKICVCQKKAVILCSILRYCADENALMSEQNHYIIDLSRLGIGSYVFDIELNDEFFASVEKSEILSGKVAAKATLNLREDDYSLMIAVRGTVFVVCDRCLDPMPLEIEDEQEIWSEEEEAFDAEGEGFETRGGKPKAKTQSIDLSWLAYEIVSINIPLVHCHPTGGCNPQMDLLLQSHLCDEPEP